MYMSYCELLLAKALLALLIVVTKCRQEVTKPAQSDNRVSSEGVRIEKDKKPIRQTSNVTPARTEAEAALISPACFHIILGISGKHGQLLDQRQSHQEK